MRTMLLVFATIFQILVAPQPARAEERARVLLVVSANGDGGEARPGFEMDEFAQAWTIFRANGFHVDVASPAGGAAKADEFDPDKIYNAQLMADPEAMKALGSTLPTASLKPTDYTAIYVLGGGGAMFDLFNDPALQSLLADAYTAGAVVGGVCHGPAVLANVRFSDGRYLVAGRHVTGFSNAEERLFGERWSTSYPALLETALRARGARFESGAPMLPHVISDGRLVTGQNPFSTAMTVEAMLRALGREPRRRDLYPDERSLLLVSRFLGGNQAVAAELAANPGAHDVMLIGIYGNILAQQAGSDRKKLRTALALMELAASHRWEPRLELSIASAEQKVGSTVEARRRVERVLQRDPQSESARRLLASFTP